MDDEGEVCGDRAEDDRAGETLVDNRAGETLADDRAGETLADDKAGETALDAGSGGAAAVEAVPVAMAGASMVDEELLPAAVEKVTDESGNV